MTQKRLGQPPPLDFPPPGGLPARYDEAEQTAMEAITSRVLEGQSLEEVLDSLFDASSALVPFDRIGVAFLEEGGLRAVCHYARARYEPVLLGKGYAADLRGSSLERVLADGRPRVISDLPRYALARPQSSSTALLVREGIRSSLTCPLSPAGRPLGFLFFASRFPEVYGEREVNILSRMAASLGWAVERAYRIGQMETALASYREVLRFVSHELKNPLASILSEGRVLEKGYAGPLSPPQKALLAKMLAKGEYLLNLIRGYLDLSRIEEGGLQPVLRPGVDLVKEVALPALEMVAPQFEAKAIRVETKLPEEPLLATADAALLRVALTNLLGNAAQYGRQGGRASLVLTAAQGSALFEVENEGPGFGAEEKGRLFRKFSRLSGAEAFHCKGSGIGLYITSLLSKIVLGNGFPHVAQ
ncbi:MAG: sensor histidine kinase, partial [Acidobacteriota bacterium]